jgi:hypothetical protein
LFIFFFSIPVSPWNVRPEFDLNKNLSRPVACSIPRILMAALKQLLINSNFHQKSASLFSSLSPQSSLNNQAILSISNENSFKTNKITYCSKNRRNIYLPRAEPRKDGIVPVEDGVSLGTLKLPGNTDVGRFETLLFQVY